MARISATGIRRASLARVTGARRASPARAIGIGRCGRRPAGFTLIELLVVVAIAGIVLAVAAVNLFPSDEEIARRETSLLALDLEAARDDAWFGGLPTAVSLEDGRVRTMRLNSERAWAVVPGRERVLPDTVQLTALAIDGNPVDLRQKLIFLPDGLGVPFRLALRVKDRDRAIEGDAAGRVRTP